MCLKRQQIWFLDKFLLDGFDGAAGVTLLNDFLRHHLAAAVLPFLAFCKADTFYRFFLRSLSFSFGLQSTELDNKLLPFRNSMTSNRLPTIKHVYPLFLMISDFLRNKCLAYWRSIK